MADDDYNYESAYGKFSLGGSGISGNGCAN